MNFASEVMMLPYCKSPVLTLGQCWSDMKEKLGGFVYLPKGRKVRHRDNRKMGRAWKPKKSWDLISKRVIDFGDRQPLGLWLLLLRIRQ